MVYRSIINSHLSLEAYFVTKSFSSTVMGFSVADEVLRSDKIMGEVSKRMLQASQLILITPVAAWAFRRINQLATKANKSF